MGKFHLRLKLQGLEVEIDGERQDLPAITNAVQHQLGGLVDSIEITANGNKQLTDVGGAGGDTDTGGRDKGRSPRRRGGSRSQSEAGVSIDFRHDPAKYGNPAPSWSVTDKCIWLLYVLKNIAETQEVSGPQLAATFNQHFKTAGKLHPPHVTRELSKAKVENPAPVGEDKGQWFLMTGEGDRKAKELINSVLNPA